MKYCECGNEVNYDGYNEIEIEDGYLVIRGDAECSECGKFYKYTECHVVDFNNPIDLELEED